MFENFIETTNIFDATSFDEYMSFKYSEADEIALEVDKLNLHENNNKEYSIFEVSDKDGVEYGTDGTSGSVKKNYEESSTEVTKKEAKLCVHRPMKFLESKEMGVDEYSLYKGLIKQLSEFNKPGKGAQKTLFDLEWKLRE